jgi:hypothetical protein
MAENVRWGPLTIVIGAVVAGTLLLGWGFFSFLSFVSGPTLKPGDQAPAAVFKTFDGKTVRLEDYRGKAVLLEFWNSG